MNTATTHAILDQAERFIAGFEDDAAQEGVEQLLAQIRAAALRHKAQMRAADSVLLGGFGPGLRAEVSHCGNNTTLTIADKAGNSDTFVQRRHCPPSWQQAWWNPAHWSLHLDRVDNLGRTWTSFAGTFVVDDFGFLVEVPQ